MIPFLRNFDFHRPSFWLGFVAGALIWWILGKLRPMLSVLREKLQAQAQAARTELFTATEIRHSNDTVLLAQRLHLANPLFSLEEIAMTPRVLAPPAPVIPGETPPLEDITEQAMPYLPDWPEMAAAYKAPTLSLAEALGGGVNLALIGRPGSGKTVALAHLATLVARHDPAAGDLAERAPFLVHAADLVLPPSDPENPLQTLVDAVGVNASALTMRKLPAFMQAAFADGRSLLLLDGLDELPPAPMNEVVEYLGLILNLFPQTRVVAAAADGYYDGLSALGFAPLPMAVWTDEQRRAFARRWGKLWKRFVAPAQGEAAPETVDPLLLNGWLVSDSSQLTPLEFTLKTWAAYAGDLLGPHSADAVEAYVRRMSFNPRKPEDTQTRQALEKLAAKMIAALQMAAPAKEADAWVAEYDSAAEYEPVTEYDPAAGFDPAGEAGSGAGFSTSTSGLSTSESVFGASENSFSASASQYNSASAFDPDEEGYPDEPAEEEIKGGKKGKKDKQKDKPKPSGVSMGRVLPQLIANGLLAAHLDDRLTFVHPAVAGYLAAQSLSSPRDIEDLFDQPEWSGRSLTLGFLAGNENIAGCIDGMLEDPAIDLLQKGPLEAARWLSQAPENTPWRSTVLRHLVGCLQKDTLSIGLRARAAVALAASGSAGVSVAFQQMLSSNQAELRQLGALGCGILREPKAVPDIANLLTDTNTTVVRAACLALVTIGDRTALEALASALLQGDEDMRRIAAEALANDAEEGHPTLQEGATIDDLMVRRAVVSGLGRVRQPWALELLEKMQVDDAEWVVKNAAAQVVEELTHPNSRIPQPLPPLTEASWLIEFAAEKGMGVAPGKPAMDLLYQMLREGSEEQRLAGLSYLRLFAEDSSVLPVYQTYFSNRGELREAAYNTLWHMAAAGITLPPPVQYGLK